MAMPKTVPVAQPKDEYQNGQNGVFSHATEPHLTEQYHGASDGLFVTEEEYWAVYYEDPDTSYEWNNGYLEAKPLPNLTQVRLFNWFFDILRRYLEVHPIAVQINQEMGFSMEVPNPEKPDAQKKTVRKPDIGIILNDNPIGLGELERSYGGICDLCIESLSDSTKKEVERDTVEKKYEYRFAGVQEYYILDPSNKNMKFYRHVRDDEYAEILPSEDGIICSEVLPGFQFRLSDLELKPNLEALAKDEVYQGYVLLEYQKEARKAEEERRRAEEAESRAKEDRQRAERYAAMLRKLNIDPDAE